MAESTSVFPFQKLWNDIYLTLEVMMYVDHLEAHEFMFTLNNETRYFLQQNIITIRNGFVNEGLITFRLKRDNLHYMLELEKLYI